MNLDEKIYETHLEKTQVQWDKTDKQAHLFTVKPIWSSHSELDKMKVLRTA